MCVKCLSVNFQKIFYAPIFLGTVQESYSNLIFIDNIFNLEHILLSIGQGMVELKETQKNSVVTLFPHILSQYVVVWICKVSFEMIPPLSSVSVTHHSFSILSQFTTIANRFGPFFSPQQQSAWHRVITQSRNPKSLFRKKR